MMEKLILHCFCTMNRMSCFSHEWWFFVLGCFLFVLEFDFIYTFIGAN